MKSNKQNIGWGALPWCSPPEPANACAVHKVSSKTYESFEDKRIVLK
jgi:hypothetical protein